MEGIEETSTIEVKSLRRIRYTLSFTLKYKIRNFLFKGSRSAELRLAVINPNYFVDYSKIISINHKAKVKKVVNLLPSISYE
ncbi:hypothetical protein CQ046_13850 [Chryseobacterium sp. MYb7]|nr:hypothetical protein CQ046_13850 [Chryseobacterium sp. MYb7]